MKKCAKKDYFCPSNLDMFINKCIFAHLSRQIVMTTVTKAACT